MTPGIDSTTQIEDSLVPVLFKPACYLSAADTVMADNHGVPILWQFVEKIGTDSAHGGENTALEVVDACFPVLADIEQCETCLSRT